MASNKILSKVTMADLRRSAEAHDYDWQYEILPNLEKIVDKVVMNTDAKDICNIALAESLGTSLKRKAIIEGKSKDDLY